MSNLNDAKIYKEYLSRKAYKKTALDVAKNNKITRNTLYRVVKRVEQGDVHRIKLCKKEANFDCLWTYKYQVRAGAIPRDRKAETIILLRRLIRDMKRDKFSTRKIALLLKKDRASILWHCSR